MLLMEEKADENSWRVQSLGDGKMEATVPTRLLKRIRPALWQHPETYRYYNSLSVEEKKKYEEEHKSDRSL